VSLSNKITQELRNKNCKNFTNLTGKTSIKDLMSYISSLDVFITGDSGPMHIAAAFQIPTVSIFGPTKVNETSQWMNNKSSILKKDLDCQPCMKRVCPLGHHKCMKKISSKDVINSALSLI
jgi:heptosyltransferase-2